MNNYGYIGINGPPQSFSNLTKQYDYKVSKATGGIVTHDKVHTVHTFVSDGTFRVSDVVGNITAEVFVIGGCGGGGSSSAASSSGSSGSSASGGAAQGYQVPGSFQPVDSEN